MLAIRKKPKAYFPSHKIYRNQDLALGVSVEADTIFLSRQWELVCVRLGEFEAAEPLQTHPADLTVVTRHDNLFDEIVHLIVPIIALSQRSSYPLCSNVKEREVLLPDKTLSLFRRNNDSPTPLIILNDQETVRKAGWSFQQTPPVGDLCCVLLSDPFDVRVRSGVTRKVITSDASLPRTQALALALAARLVGHLCARARVSCSSASVEVPALSGASADARARDRVAATRVRNP